MANDFIAKTAELMQKYPLIFMTGTEAMMLSHRITLQYLAALKHERWIIQKQLETWKKKCIESELRKPFLLKTYELFGKTV